jgi:hypothetical protein
MVYAPKDQQIALMENLAAQYPLLIKSEIIGHSVLGKPIRMYRIGNPNGGKLLIDGQIHGGSDISTWLLYYYVKWLVESGEAVAKRILERNCTLIVPIVNIDMDTRKNAAAGGAGYGGVDLNRNFVYNWSSAGSTDPNSEYYRGPSPASEPETQALKGVFERELPKFYMNMHNWGGEKVDSYAPDSAKRSYNATVYAKFAAMWQQLGLKAYTPYNNSSGLPAGYAVSDAYQSGIPSCWLIEIVKVADYPGERPPFEDIEGYFFPRFKVIPIVFSQECEIAGPTKKYVFKQWQDGDTNPTKTINV